MCHMAVLTMACRWSSGVRSASVMGVAAIAGVPTGIECELHEICEAELAAGSGRGAARQSSKGFQVNRVGPFRYQVRVQEILVSELVVGIVMDVLGKIVVNGLKLFLVVRIATAARNLVILDSCKLVVLHPKVGLENFRRCRKPEQGGVAFGELAALFFCTFLSEKLCVVAKQRGAHGCGTRGGESFFHE